MKAKIYHTIRTIQKSNRIILEAKAKSIPLTHIYMTTNGVRHVNVKRLEHHLKWKSCQGHVYINKYKGHQYSMNPQQQKRSKDKPNSIKTGGELICSGKVNCSQSTSVALLVRNQAISVNNEERRVVIRQTEHILGYL